MWAFWRHGTCDYVRRLVVFLISKQNKKTWDFHTWNQDTSRSRFVLKNRDTRIKSGWVAGLQKCRIIPPFFPDKNSQLAGFRLFFFSAMVEKKKSGIPEKSGGRPSLHRHGQYKVQNKCVTSIRSQLRDELNWWCVQKSIFIWFVFWLMISASFEEHQSRYLTRDFTRRTETAGSMSFRLKWINKLDEDVYMHIYNSILIRFHFLQCHFFKCLPCQFFKCLPYKIPAGHKFS